MKKIIIPGIIIIIAITIIFFLLNKPSEKRPFNLTEPERHTVKIDGKEYTFDLYKYDPPYIIGQLVANKEEADCFTPEGTFRALRSAGRRNREWYLFLLDKSMKKKIFAINKKSGGKALEGFNKDAPLDLLKEGNHVELSYKVEIEIKKKKYALINKIEFIEKQKDMRPSIEVFSNTGNRWFNSYDLAGHPIEDLVGLKAYEELKAICETGTWTDPIKHDSEPK